MPTDRKRYAVRSLTLMILAFFIIWSPFHARAAADDVESIQIVPEKVKVKTGERKRITVLAKKENGSAIIVSGSSLKIKDPEIAILDGQAVKGLSPGKTVLTAEYKGIKTEAVVEVIQDNTQSVYQTVIDLPEQILTGAYTPAPISISASSVKKRGAENIDVHLSKLSGPGDLIAVHRSERVKAVKNTGDLLTDIDLKKDHSETLKTEWRFSKAGTYTFKVELTNPHGDVIAETVKTAEVLPSFQDLGTQIEKLLAMRGAFGKDENGRPSAYTVLAGRPALLVVTDVETEQIKRIIPLPEAEAAWAVTVASDGTVYAGSTPNGTLYKYVPGSSEAEVLGKPVPKQTVIWDLTAGENGKVYGGTYFDGHIFEYDPAKGFTDFGEMVPGEEYVRSVAYDPEENAVYAGVGAHAHLIKYNIKTGEKRNVLPEKYKSYISVYDLQIQGGKLFIKLEPEFKLVVADKKTLAVDYETTAQSRGVSPLSPDGKSVFYTSSGILYQYNVDSKTASPVTSGGAPVNLEQPVIGFGFQPLSEPPFSGIALVGFTGNYEGRFFKYNLESGALKKTVLPLPPQPTNIYNVLGGPDGKIYSSGFIGGDVGIYNPLTGLTRQETGLGQVEGMASIGSKMYFGVYPMARIYEYDSSLPWNRRTNMKFLFDLHGPNEQNRPVAMDSIPERDEVYMGTVPDYGKNGGTLSIYNRSTGNLMINRNIVPNQSIVSVKASKGKVYAGSSIFGGTGADPTEKEARLITWDPASSRVTNEIAPVPGKVSVSYLHADQDGKIWGIAQDTLFIYDPVQNKTIYQEVKFPGVRSYRVGGNMEEGPDGDLYVTVDQTFYKISKTTKEVTPLKQNAKKLAEDSMGNFYFAQGDELSTGNNIWRYTIEDPVIRAEAVELKAERMSLSEGEAVKLEASVIPDFATNKEIQWYSSNSGVASVEQDGTVKALSSGEAVITAVLKNGTKSDAVTIQVGT
ncbi:Ig-like domain-containing protein [Bacillus sp. FJAT-42376]|uniref:Ig-like domain-containing protein n=1 Tax=Bacillus sp. FJAT-42376 TaxID=2014076 RepID=UPI0013DDE6D9|nr:Ig-like domain-containing protein [Bacillus sp. FJAT-42376]